MKSKHYDMVKQFYDRKLWTETMVNNAVGRWITLEEAQEILRK